MKAGVIDSCIREIKDGCGEIVSGISLHGNEVHVSLKDQAKIPLACNFVRSVLGSRLAMIVCTDERGRGEGFVLRHVFEKEDGDVFVLVTARIEGEGFPSIVPDIPAAALYEREIHDMFGLEPIGNPDTRPLVLHEHWPAGLFPLRKDFDIKTKAGRVEGRYRFQRVEGDGICEIPVGPVHAGVIEPGHFRISTLGENIVNLETKLWYTHKGTEKIAESMGLEDAVRLSERISGDESVANSTAYCQAVERIAGVEVPQRARQIRAVFCELERAYNHIGTLGGMATDAGFAFGAARLYILKERLMQLNDALCGSRILFGINRVGGVNCDIGGEGKRLLLERLGQVMLDFEKVTVFLRSKSSLMDRLKGTGIIPRAAARDLGIVGVAARCAGIDIDTRRDHPYAGYVDRNGRSPQQLVRDQVEMEKRQGDALARFDLRVREVGESEKIIRDMLDLEDDGVCATVPEMEPFQSALGYAESHRGQTLHWVMTGKGNSVYRYKVRTASFCNWTIIGQAVSSDIVPDFPLVNKSFDLSYSGNDL